MNKLRILFIATGTVLIIAALFLCLYNAEENKRAGEEAGNTLSELIAAIPEPTQKPTETAVITTAEPDLYAQYETTTTTAPPLPTIELNGRLYCGYITISALDLELPVANELDYNVLRTSPCRYRGTAEGGDLIIAAHNYNSHFGKLKDLSAVRIRAHPRGAFNSVGACTPTELKRNREERRYYYECHSETIYETPYARLSHYSTRNHADLH